MKHAVALLVSLVLLSAVVGCKTDRPAVEVPVAPPGATTNAFYLLGVAQGRQHIPQMSAIVFPTESTNWPAESRELYRFGYLEGMRTK